MKPPHRTGVVRIAKEVLKGVWHRVFLVLEKVGLHVTPVHFYSGLPQIGYLKKHPEQWMGRSQLPGIRMNVEKQIENLRRICLPFQKEYQGLSIYWDAVRENGEPGYGEIESQVLHGFVRSYKPRRVVQVGCGLATHCVVHALTRNEAPYEITCIEPYPNDALRRSKRVRLVEKPVQLVPPGFFSTLGANDFLLVDSTHVAQVGSDVNYLILEILPRLAPGVVVSFHDIYFPYDYPRNFLKTVLFPLETSLLRAFLIHNPKAEIIACLSQLHYDRPEALKTIFPDYRPQQNVEGLDAAPRDRGHFPSSLWLTINP